ncbi:hypothetical protein Ccrd_017351, partial [Cynara cardunculus var. scolymus]
SVQQQQVVFLTAVQHSSRTAASKNKTASLTAAGSATWTATILKCFTLSRSDFMISLGQLTRSNSRVGVQSAINNKAEARTKQQLAFVLHIEAFVTVLYRRLNSAVLDSS